MKTCKICSQPISEGRLKAMPGTTVCTEHSAAAPYVGNIINYGKNEDDSYQEIEVIRDPSLAEKLNHYKSQLGQSKGGASISNINQ